MEVVKRVLKGMSNEDANQVLDTIVPKMANKAPPQKQVNKGTKEEPWTEHSPLAWNTPTTPPDEWQFTRWPILPSTVFSETLVL